MTLKETVSKIKGYEVTETHARIFASEHYGVLATYIRGQFIDSLKVTKQVRLTATNKIAQKTIQRKSSYLKQDRSTLPKYIYRNKTGTYRASFRHGIKTYSCGSFNTIQEAQKAVEDRRKEII